MQHPFTLSSPPARSVATGTDHSPASSLGRVSLRRWLRAWLIVPMSLALVAMLAACSSAPGGSDGAGTGPESTTESVDELIAAARNAGGERRALLSLDALALMSDLGVDRGDELRLDEINLAALPDADLRLPLVNARARQLLANEQIAETQALLSSERNTQAASPLRAEFLELLGAAAFAAGDATLALSSYLDAADANGLTQTLSDRIWQVLQSRDQEQLRSLASSANSYALRGWIELARVHRNDQFSIRSQMNAVSQWQRTWTQHAAVDTLPSALLELETVWQTRPRHIGLLLPMQQPAGIAIQEGFLGAYYEALQATRDVPSLSVYDTSDSIDVDRIYQQAVADGVDLIIGPLNKESVNRLQRMDTLPVPTLALNYADVSAPGPDNLFQFGLAPEDEIQQAASLAWQLGHRHAALLTPQNADYQRLQSAIANTWTELGGRVVSNAGFGGDGDYAAVVQRLMAIDSSRARAERLLDLLPRQDMEFTPRRRADIDFIFLIANPRQGRQIKPTLAFYFAEDLPVFSIPSIYDGLENPAANRDLNGIIFSVEPWLLDPDSDIKQTVSMALRPAQGPLQRLRALGIDSYRLHARLQQLDQGAITYLQGSTGELSLGPFQRIRRRLPLARFEDGLAIPFASSEIAAGE